VSPAGAPAARQATLPAASAAHVGGGHRAEPKNRPAGTADRSKGPTGRSRLTGGLVIAVPAATSLVVGGYEIGGPSLWRDEAYTKDAINRSVGQIFTLLGHMDAVHGAYYLLMHVVAAAIGTSATALRFPSLCAMVVATAFTAAIGRRTAALAQPPDTAGPGRLNVPALTGFASGMVFATAPYMTYYAQMARSYAVVTMFATVSTYLLLVVHADGRWRWWSAYAVAAALTGLFNIFGLLILAAHGVTLLLTDARGQSRNGRQAGRVPLRWLAAAAAAVIVLIPLVVTTRLQHGGDSLPRLRGFQGTDPPGRGARAGRHRGELPRGPLAAAESGRGRAAVADGSGCPAARGVAGQAGL
jgi:mannosyltransferase